MATYTVLQSSVLRNTVSIVIEFTVPAGNNSAGIAWKTIVAEKRIADNMVDTTANPTKSNNLAHRAALDAGSLVEIPLTIEFNANATTPAKISFIDAAASAKVAEFTSGFASLYEFYGTVRPI